MLILAVDPDNKKIASIVAGIAIVTLSVTGWIRYSELADPAYLLGLRVALVLVILIYVVAIQLISTQRQFELTTAIMLYIANLWILTLAWDRSFSVEASLGLMVVILVSQLLMSERVLSLIYCLSIFSMVALGLLNTANPAVNPVFFLIVILFCLITNHLVITKWNSNQSILLKNEAKLQEARRHAEEAVKARGQFMANMSHEVRTPLNGIIGNASLLESMDLTEEQQDLIETISMSSQLLMSLVNDILDFSKMELTDISLDESETDLEQLASQCVEMLMPMANKKGLRLLLDTDVNTHRSVICDSSKLSQIFVNLLNNSIKFTENGEVRLELATQARDGEELDLICRVVDTGIGIPSDQLDSIFEEFSQADESVTRRFGGTGLGLAICRRLLQAMGGDISVASEVGEGTTFSFSLPVVKTKRAIDADEARFAELEGRALMLITPCASLRKIYSNNLLHWGMQLFHVESTEELLSRLNSIHDADELPEYLLMDLDLPPDALNQLVNEVEAIYGARKPTLLLFSTSRQIRSRALSQLSLVNPVRPAMLLSLLLKSSADVAVRPEVDNSSDLPVLDNSALRILLVEDNEVNQKVACAILKRLGYSADVAVNGLDALVQVHVGHYDVIFMDIQMPEMDGLTAARKIRQLKIEQPTIIALTANAYEKDREACLEAGMDDFMPKPLKLDEMREMLLKTRKSPLNNQQANASPGRNTLTTDNT